MLKENYRDILVTRHLVSSRKEGPSGQLVISLHSRCFVSHEYLESHNSLGHKERMGSSSSPSHIFSGIRQPIFTLKHSFDTSTELFVITCKSANENDQEITVHGRHKECEIFCENLTVDFHLENRHFHFFLYYLRLDYKIVMNISTTCLIEHKTVPGSSFHVLICNK